MVIADLQPISPVSPGQNEALEQQILSAGSGKCSDLGGEIGLQRVSQLLEHAGASHTFLLCGITCLSLLPFVSALKAETPAQTKLAGKACN